MTDSEFWNLIARVDRQALDRGDEADAVLPVQAALSGKTEAELVEFQEALAQKLYAIDGEAYAQNAGESGSSDDAFLYARLYVVARGREYYEAVRSHPGRMPKSIREWCEPLLYVHKYAWEALTGRSVSQWPYSPTVSYESGSNPDLWTH
jgi:uncharacterized protein DUF4240